MLLTGAYFVFLHKTRNRMKVLYWDVDGLAMQRTRVAVLFPNAASALRLVTGVIIEIHEDWITGKQYLDMTPLLHKNLKNE
ncbi:MAG: transposase, partial [Chlamydiia bacterium]